MSTLDRVRRFCRGIIRGSLVIIPVAMGLLLGNSYTTKEVIKDAGWLPQVYTRAEQNQTLGIVIEQPEELFTEDTSKKILSDKLELSEEFDYLAEAKENQVLYEELHIDPTSPRKLGEQELNYTLKQLARKNEKFQEIYEKREELPWGLKASVCNYPEMIDFVLGFFHQKDFEAGYTKAELEQKYPLLLQWDKRWGYHPYGGYNVATSGCAPTCLAMVAFGLTRDEEITPDVVGDYAMKQKYYLPGTGTKWALLSEGAEQFGLHAIFLERDEELIREKLENGMPVICSMKEGNFTSIGHFIVLTGLDEDGLVCVNDPNSLARSERRWKLSTVISQTKQMWGYTLEGVGVSMELVG